MSFVLSRKGCLIGATARRSMSGISLISPNANGPKRMMRSGCHYFLDVVV